MSALRAHVAGGLGQHAGQGQLVGANGDVGLGYDYRRLRVGESVYYDDEDWETLSFTYDARGNLLDRYDDWMYDEFQYVYADGIDEVVLERSGDYYGMEVYALVTDHLGSVVRRFNPDGSLSVGGEYHPFGDPPVLLGDVSGRLWFTGREYDAETGLYYYRNRWYSTELGRFLEPDPIGLAGRDVNLYRYVGNSALNSTDPQGLFTLAEIVVVGVVLVGIGVIAWKAWGPALKAGRKFTLDDPTKMGEALEDAIHADTSAATKVAVSGGGLMVVKVPPETVAEAVKHTIIEEGTKKAVEEGIGSYCPR